MININKQEVVDYLEQSIILNLYKKDPETVYQDQVNSMIVDLYKFDPYEVDIVKPKPFMISEISFEDLTSLYKEAASKACKHLQLNLVENPKSDYVPKENDYLIVIHNYQEPTENISSNPQLQMKRVMEANEHAMSLASSFRNPAGGLVLFFNTEKAPYIHKSLTSFIGNPKYFGVSTRSVISGFGTSSNFDLVEKNYQLTLKSLLTPIQINELKPEAASKMKMQ